MYVTFYKLLVESDNRKRRTLVKSPMTMMKHELMIFYLLVWPYVCSC